MRSILDAGDRKAILGRLDRLRPDDGRRWGRMTPHQAVVHLTDTLRVGFGDRPVDPDFRVPMRGLTRFVAFTLPLPWPRGVRTAPALDQEAGGGTPPEDFAEDVAELRRHLDRFVEAGGDLPTHPIWGDLRPSEAGRYVWRHLNHHLRQFGR